jgi:hypothetical protein
MIIGIVTILYFIFAIWTIWFSKKKSEKLVARILYSVLAFILVLLLSSISFSPKTSFFIKSFPMNLDREFKETVVIEDYTLVIYQDEDSYGFEVFYKFLGVVYVEDSLLINNKTFKNVENDTLLRLMYVKINNQDYLLLFNDDFRENISLILDSQEVDIDSLEEELYSVILVNEGIDNLETVILDNQTYNVLEIE